MKAANTFRCVGLMSGTSLDGLDICYVQFSRSGNGWTFKIEAADTVKYTEAWETQLANAQHLHAIEFVNLHNTYGVLLGAEVNRFLQARPHLPRPDFVSSHGHTVFHQPHRGITWQIGSGASVAAECGITTVCDFRSLDVALHGQGAPLVPIGDQLLFGNYAACLNLGGFANISYLAADKRIAFDICPVNMVLNGLASRCGLAYDDGGKLAQQGSVNEALLADLNNLSFYTMQGPKSLGREWVETQVWPIIDRYSLSVNDALRTFVQHIVVQMKKIDTAFSGTMLVTGGGAYNRFLIDEMRKQLSCHIEVPDSMVVEFKEALIFAFLGLLRITENNNSLRSVTGARCDSCTGAIHFIM